MDRVIIKLEEDRNNFFARSLEYSKFKTWKDLFASLNIPKATYENYKNGKITIPLVLFDNLSKDFNSKEVEFFKERIMLVNENWGVVKGGKINYSKHKSIFDQGRRKAIQVNIKKSHRFDLNLPLNSDLAYLIGLFIGDGFTNKYQRHYLIQFVGNKSEENFYKERVYPVVRTLFNLNPKIKYEKNANAIRFNIYSKQLFLLLTKRFKIKAGLKFDVVLISDEILKADREILLDCIAGIYDAESRVFWDTRKSYSKPYPRIDLHMCNPRLIRQIFEILTEEGIDCSLNGDGERILIYGEENISFFLRKVKLRNSKNLQRLNHLVKAV